MCDLRILSGSWLKVLAVTAMLVDHTAAFLLRDAGFANACLFQVGDRAVTLYFIMRCIGRTAFPLFAFLIVEGFVHTHDRFLYGRNLLLFALISELPFNLVNAGQLSYPVQNVFVTLLFGYLGLCAIKGFQNDLKRQVVSLLSLLVLSIFFHADYGCTGFAFIVMLYMLRHDKLVMSVIGSCFLSSKWIAGLAFIPICMYNGRRGFVHGIFLKYLFYFFYPLHLLAIWLIRMAV